MRQERCDPPHARILACILAPHLCPIITAREGGRDGGLAVHAHRVSERLTSRPPLASPARFVQVSPMEAAQDGEASYQDWQEALDGLVPGVTPTTVPEEDNAPRTRSRFQQHMGKRKLEEES